MIWLSVDFSSCLYLVSYFVRKFVQFPKHFFTTTENSDDFCFGCKRYAFGTAPKDYNPKNTIQGGDLMVCDFRKPPCTRAWCLECLGYKEVPSDDFICPIHKCNTEKCQKPVGIYRCFNCKNSVCDKCYKSSNQKLKLKKIKNQQGQKVFHCGECKIQKSIFKQ